jgi:hypothetical protein
MFFNIILLFTVLCVLFIGLQYTSKELFANVPANDTLAQHQRHISDSQVKFSKLTNMINLTSPSIGINPVSASNMNEAVSTIFARPTSTTHQLEKPSRNNTPDQLPSTLEVAQMCEAAPNSCAAFDDDKFAKNCGISFDPASIDSAGHTAGIGGLYVSSFDHEEQMAAYHNVQQTGAAPYFPLKTLAPTIGKAKVGTFSLNKDQCTIVKETVDCESKQTFGTPNCTQCYTSGQFSRVGPESGRLPSTLNLYGSGNVTMSSRPRGLITLEQTKLDLGKGVQITIPPNSEGTILNISVNGTLPIYLCGYIEGPTATGTFKLDVRMITDKDTVTGLKPRMTGTRLFNGFKCFTLMPGSGKSSMNLLCYIPFSFVNMFDGAALTCENGPIITSENSATFLESDPCYAKGNAPGNYKLECLQTRWTELGGSIEGTGYPSNQAKANAIQKDANGGNLRIDAIVDVLAVKMAEAESGNNANGVSLSIPDWNAVSMYGLGIPITNPCDGANNANGPVSKACAAYLYANKGIDSRIGRTYTQPPSQVASSKEKFEDVPNTFNYPGTVIDPNNAAGSQFAQNLGGVSAVKQKYDEINRLANDNTKPNATRATALKQAYDIILGQPSSAKVTGPTQVFAVGPGYDYLEGQSREVCAKYGATVATTAQLQDAYAHGADWCFSGWVAEGGGKWPITLNPIPGCGSRTGIIEWTPNFHSPSQAGVTCYGPKPGITDPVSQNGTIKPFNQQMWDRPTEPTYLTIPSGYLETTGPQPSCFSGLSVDAAQKGCNALGSQCVGFSYSKDGAGNGCYKGNHNAGINGNPAYMGYVKTPVSNANSVIRGRYIKLQYNRVDYLNLAEIKVYSKKGGPNIITPNTPVTKPSGYQGDVFPARNFVDGDTGETYNFACTSGGDVPWIQVDLGSMIEIYKVVVYNREDCCRARILGAVLQILNDENDMIYVSNNVNSTNRNYAWFPPSVAIKVDVPEDFELSVTNPMRGDRLSDTWDQARDNARIWDSDSRLPTHAEVRKYIASRGNRPLFDEDMWWPVIDSPNAWVSVGNNDPSVRLGKRHEQCCGGPPGWGTTNQYFPFRSSVAVMRPIRT